MVVCNVFAVIKAPVEHAVRLVLLPIITEEDHRIPLFRVWREYRDAPWPELLRYWGLPNPQVINHEAHVAKCSTEARNRRAARYSASGLA
jgi:hypothetical protein